MAITNLGNSYRDLAMSGLRDVASMEAQREATNKQLAESKKQTQIGTTATGAVAGAYFGAKAGSVGGPAGAAIGAVGGFLFSSLF